MHSDFSLNPHLASSQVVYKRRRHHVLDDCANVRVKGRVGEAHAHCKGMLGGERRY